ncbi:MAG TPA: DUF3142 domain-containing protein [Thermoanaerobaculia bacterium]|nr:DUF3142 domain-containing protein [Thermoanaerobaculia bacterium]
MRRLLPILLLLLAACRSERASGPLRQEAYVWQRSWTPSVREAVAEARGFAGIVVLAAEVDFRGAAPRVVRVPLAGPSLRASGRPVGVAVRVLSFPGRFGDDPRLGQSLAKLARSLLAEAKAQGLPVSEIQIDYDCPESKLDDYRGLLPVLREAVAPVPVVITALPAWLSQKRAFGELMAAADGTVLQVHSLSPPRGPDERIVLCDPEAAREWVEAAARFGRPFRVALPTYGYAAAFDRNGTLLGLSAEGPRLSWPQGVRVETARSDPAAMAGLVRGWTADRPPELTGLLWYRLPVPEDRLNWTAPTLAAVMAGREPRAALRGVSREPEPGLVEIDLVNVGDGEAPWPSPVRVRWSYDTFLAADGLGGYRVRRRGDREILLERTGSSSRPGERRVVAWLRFSAPTEVQVEIPR